MRYLVRKNHKRIHFFFRLELERLLLRVLVKNLYLPTVVRNFALYSLSFKHGSFSKIRGICLKSGRTRSVYSYLRLSRHQVNYMMNKSFLTGFKKGVF